MAIEKTESTLSATGCFKSEVSVDERLFGSLNSEIADALADYVRKAIIEGVESLPLVTDQEKIFALKQKIEGACMRNIDIMESYGSRNIFTLRNYTRRRQLHVLHASNPSLREVDMTEGNTQVILDQSALIILPTSAEMPSLEQMNQLERELVQLKERLNATRLLRNELASKYHGLESAIAVSNVAVTALLEISTENVAFPVNQVVSKGKDLRELTNECKEMIHQLGTTKKARNNDVENDEIPASMKEQTKRKRLSMEDEYKLDRKVLQSNTVSSLDALRSILRP
ncbi:unnamed protein product [Cylindrotheca closterium]|uniref:Protein MIS12 homolog n=1 Tax=Cylindrotheca closterium TaxID=2856 RepID=A0AAD2CKC9_9STRA|nr:unnamed protein product [Cylindrotheca closterium]